MTNPFDTDNAPTVEPDVIIQGNHALWRRVLDYDDSAYSLAYEFRPVAGGSVVSAAGTQSTDYWVFEIAGAVTSTLPVGGQAWDLVLTRTSDSARVVIETGHLDVFATTGDRRTHAEIMVAKIESVLQGRADADVSSYTIKSRSISKMSPQELTQWRDYYLAEIDRTGGSSVTSGAKRNTVRVRFV